MPRSRPQRRTATSLASATAREKVVEDARSPGLWLVLALVIEQPSHGYEITQRYQRRFGPLLPMSVPRIYAALDRLRDAGMIKPITLKPVKPTGKQHLMRRSYQATAAGAKAYHQWAAGQMRDDPQRSQLLCRIASTGLFGIDAVLDVIDRYQRECLEELRTLPAVREGSAEGQLSLEELTETLVVDQQRRELGAQNDWAVHARQVLEAHKHSAPTQDGRRKSGRRVDEAS
jgi:DNA-binding PadR family transcriptional regulator